MKNNNSLGQKIRSFRKAVGISQQELEIAIETSFGTISRIEHNQTNPTKETLLKIISTLNIGPYDAASLFEIDISSELIKLLDISKIMHTFTSIDQLANHLVNNTFNEIEGAWGVVCRNPAIFS